MSPLEIKILLACYCLPEPERGFEPANWGSPAAQEARERFYQAGVLRADTNAVTGAGKALVGRLTSIPMLEGGE